MSRKYLFYKMKDERDFLNLWRIGHEAWSWFDIHNITDIVTRMEYDHTIRPATNVNISDKSYLWVDIAKGGNIIL